MNCTALNKCLATVFCSKVCRQAVGSMPCVSSAWPTCSQVRQRHTNWHMLKDHKRRQVVKEGYAERMRLNAIRKNNILPKDLQELADQEIAQLPRDSNPIRLVSRCALTSRPRGVRRPWRVSRIVFRHLADYNKLSGVTRSSR